MTHRCHELHSDTKLTHRNGMIFKFALSPSPGKLIQLHSSFINQEIIDKVAPQIKPLGLITRAFKL